MTCGPWTGPARGACAVVRSRAPGQVAAGPQHNWALAAQNDREPCFVTLVAILPCASKKGSAVHLH